MPRFKKERGKRSGFELEVEAVLQKKYKRVAYEQEYLEYVVPEKVQRYLPDFIISKGRKTIYFESKGRFTAADRKKLLLVKESHPKLDLRLLFQADNWLTKKHKSRYSDWARKHGFAFHVWNLKTNKFEPDLP